MTPQSEFLGCNSSLARIVSHNQFKEAEIDGDPDTRYVTRLESNEWLAVDFVRASDPDNEN